MTASVKNSVDSGCFLREADDWTTYRLAQPAIEPTTVDLLALSTRSQPGNMRFANDNGKTVLVAELRDPGRKLSLDEARERLFEAAARPADESFHVEVAMALGDTGYEWSPAKDRTDQWQVTVDDSRNNRCELAATIVEDGVEIRGLVANWEAAPAEVAQAAISRYLAFAHARVRFVRFSLVDGQAIAVSFAAADRLDVELPDGVAAVVAAHRLVWREVRALANAAVARLYLEGVNRPKLD
jgi:hypothetical protein